MVWMKPNMTVAPQSASESKALQTYSDTCVQHGQTSGPDCEEKRDLRESDENRRALKWSLTLMPD